MTAPAAPKPAPCGHADKSWHCPTCSAAAGKDVWHCSVCLFERPMEKTNVYSFGVNPRPEPEQMKGAEDGFPGSDYPHEEFT